MKKLSNISLKEFLAVLTALGLHKMRTKEDTRHGHAKGCAAQSSFKHVNPVSELVVRKTINDLGITQDEFLALLELL